MYKGIDENKVLKNLEVIAKACEFCEKKEENEIEKEKYADWNADILEAVNLIRKLLNHVTPQPITHEATRKMCHTCPSCQNVVGKFETFGDGKIFIKDKYCIFCGQALDWSNESI